jgi:hypothetical protein
MTKFLYGAGQVAVGVAVAWLLVTGFYETFSRFNDKIQAIRCQIWKRENPWIPEGEHGTPS